jgi:hypothetical protein
MAPAARPAFVPSPLEGEGRVRGDVVEKFVLRVSRRAALLGLLALPAIFLAFAAGCTNPAKSQKQKPAEDYVVRGRVVDAESGQPIPQARVRFLAPLQTLLGPRSVSTVVTTGPNGSCEIKLGGAYPVIRSAQQIRIDAGAEGYAAAGVDLPVPKEKQNLNAAPDIRLTKVSPKPLRPRPGKAAPVRKPAPTTDPPLPWKE